MAQDPRFPVSFSRIISMGVWHFPLLACHLVVLTCAYANPPATHPLSEPPGDLGRSVSEAGGSVIAAVSSDGLISVILLLFDLPLKLYSNFVSYSQHVLQKRKRKKKSVPT